MFFFQVQHINRTEAARFTLHQQPSERDTCVQRPNAVVWSDKNNEGTMTLQHLLLEMALGDGFAEQIASISLRCSHFCGPVVSSFGRASESRAAQRSHLAVVVVDRSPAQPEVRCRVVVCPSL